MALGLEFRQTVAQGEAARIWNLYKFKSPSELILETLALTMKVLVLDGTLESADARLIRSDDSGLIRVKSTIREPGRRRFAISHEIGHWLLHKGRSQIFACTNQDMLATYKTNPDEADANFFASALLMPEHLFRPRIQNQTFSKVLISDLADYFQTSLTATAIRYCYLTEDYCAVVSVFDGKISWWRGSNNFENRFWIHNGTKISATSIAAKTIPGQMESSEIDITEWSARGAYRGSDTFIEESVSFKNYDYTLVFLRLP
jgi:Zn-dependent peptidase ImmA (M78 family)